MNKKPGRKKQMISWQRMLSLLVISMVAGWGYCSYLSPGAPSGNGSKKIQYEVRRGVGSYVVSRELAEQGLLKNPRYFRLYLRLTGRANKIKAGIYELNDNQSAEEIANILTSGKVRMMSLTIPEGWNHKQIGNYLQAKGMVKSREEFIRLSRDRGVLKKYKIAAKSTEGYLFPDTYTMPLGYTAKKFQELMLRRFFIQIEKSGKPEGMKPSLLHQKVILASIVEREAVKAAERPMMAQVFVNRMKKGMRLESCATIQFLLPQPRERLYNKDLAIASPYNTYLHKGLPPGPISNPGLAALQAVFKPKAGSYIYFVLKPDRSHHFSETYQEHLAAKKRYLGR